MSTVRAPLSVGLWACASRAMIAQSVFYVTDEICARIDNGLRCEYNGLCVRPRWVTLRRDRRVMSSVTRLPRDEGLCRASEDGAMCVFYATDCYCEAPSVGSNRCRAEVDGGGCTYTHVGCGARVR